MSYRHRSDVPKFVHIVLHKDVPIVVAKQAPANVVGKYFAQGQYMPPYVPYQSVELELKADFTLAATMTLPDGQT